MSLSYDVLNKSFNTHKYSSFSICYEKRVSNSHLNLLLSVPVWLYRNRIKLHLHSEHLYRCHQHAYSHKSGRYRVKRPWHRDRPLIHKFNIIRVDQRGLSSDGLREAMSLSSVKTVTINFLYFLYTNRTPLLKEHCVIIVRANFIQGVRVTIYHLILGIS